MFDDDPEFGKFVANFPNNRLRLLLTSGAILATVWFVVTVALWRVEANLASVITVGIVSLAALGVGWYVAHFWNRELTMYQRGFSYREGSHVVFISYAEIIALRQQAERRVYFGGLLKRIVYRTTLKTTKDENIVLNNLYRRMDELNLRLEQETIRLLKPMIERSMANGEKVPFGDFLSLNATGIYQHRIAANPYHDDQSLLWTDFAGYQIEGGRLILRSKAQGDWGSIPLESIDNLRLLLELLQKRP